MKRGRFKEAKKYMIRGEMMTILDACKKYGKNYATVQVRIRRNGYSLEDALFKPVNKYFGADPTEEWKKLSNEDRGYRLAQIE